jgi:hypothetical protein
MQHESKYFLMPTFIVLLCIHLYLYHTVESRYEDFKMQGEILQERLNYTREHDDSFQFITIAMQATEYNLHLFKVQRRKNSLLLNQYLHDGLLNLPQVK